MSIDVTASHDVAETSNNTDDPVSSCEITEADTTSFEIDESEDEATITDMLVDDVATAPALNVAPIPDALCNNGERQNDNVGRLRIKSRSSSRSSSSSSHSNSSTYSIGNIPRDANANLASDLNKNEFIAVVTINTLNPLTTSDLADEQTTAFVEPQPQQQRTNNTPAIFSRADTTEDNSGSKTSTASHTTSSTPTTADVANVAMMDASAFNLLKKNAAHALPATQAQLQMIVASAATAQQLQQQPQLLIESNNAASISEDNISFSIATTTTTTITDLDTDNICTASPDAKLMLAKRAMLQNQLAANFSENSRSVSANADNDPTTALSYVTSGNDMPIPPVVTVKTQWRWVDWTRWLCLHFKSSGIGEPSVYHALVVIFLEFFAWGLLTMPVISTLNQTFPDHTFLMNGLVMGIKGILSFLSAPLVGALSDIWGRKFFLLITVFFTCAPIPLMAINSWWFFAMISISGALAVTFSVVFAYVADVTTVEERSRAYGLVSATFAASLVISPALGALLMETYGDTLVAALATAIAVLDVFFILVAVPESLPEKIRPSSWGAPISWEQADPFSALRKVGSDQTILMQCVAVLLSYLPEAGQYSCIFVYLKLKMGFNSMEVAVFIAVVGTLSISVQVTLGYLMRVFGAKNTIILGLVLEMLQLLWYGLGSKSWMMWAAGILAALGSITYPAISAFVSIHSHPDRQGAVQGMVTGMRGLCNGLGPALFGVVFYLFNVDLNDDMLAKPDDAVQNESNKYTELIPGPPFAIGALMVILAILVAIYIPDKNDINVNRTSSEKKRASVDVQYEIECGNKSTSPLAPLMRSDSMAQL
ncbi:hippocampus abundant transcript 1 protein isoform X1 [Zeugodacus cucurbitae]|uniref:hippocampus abundant transcript 1 protein isoform X1 n=1 Tax=Zeugodacus cucurbitae TaxID=28588 RepID=UPI000596A705|nr:hippocampus abundant transcript 1 protein isoform X1 [Zeugodacus cucurbitae]XP_054086323.1 hippocampus abundant transcript 1 protein isoform X1 [Zeugodacus cucurbitae]XP_054086324.1 hippocampus abundant transcript 1 protein isoform X1 [Zeugodacus cucurbitae]